MPDVDTTDPRQLARLQALGIIPMGPNIPQPRPIGDETPPDTGTMQPIATPKLQPMGESSPVKPLNFHERQLQPITAPAGSADSYQQQLQKIQDARQNPWGSAENHPGTLGKVGHVLSTIGQIAGTAVAPGVVASIPGTNLNMAEKEGQLGKEYEGAKKEESTEADTDRARTTAEKQEASEEPLRTAQTREMNAKASVEEQKPDNALDKKVGEYVNKAGKQTIIWQKGDGETYEKQYGESNVKEPAEKPQAGSLDGKPTFALYDPQKGWLDSQTHQSIPGFRPAPNYAEVMPGITAQRQLTQTKTMFGADGKPHEFSFNPKSGKYDIEQGFATTGQAGSREAQANVIQTAGQNLIQDISAQRDNLGNLSAWYKQHTFNVPYVGDPDLAELDAQLHSFAYLQPALHGFRSHNAAEAFEKIIGGLATEPDVTIGKIRGILKTAGTLGTTSGGGATESDKDPLGIRK